MVARLAAIMVTAVSPLIRSLLRIMGGSTAGGGVTMMWRTAHDPIEFFLRHAYGGAKLFNGML